MAVKLIFLLRREFNSLAVRLLFCDICFNSLSQLLAIDALQFYHPGDQSQFCADLVLRELNKAFVGFLPVDYGQLSPNCSIVTSGVGIASVENQGPTEHAEIVTGTIEHDKENNFGDLSSNKYNSS